MKNHRHTRLFSTVIHSLFALTVLACSKESTKQNKLATPAFRVALLTPGPISDQAWNAGAYQGLLRIRDSLGASISHIQTQTPADIEENFRQYGAQGYDLVFGHGFEFQDPAIRVAPQFPKTTYVNVSATKTAANVAGIDFAFYDGAYLAGMVAGANTTSNIIGVIGGTELPPVVQAFDAFEAGAKMVNPKVKVLKSYIGNWDDVSAAKEQALAQIARGADMLFQNADNAGLGVFQAVRESKDKHVRVFGANSDQNNIAPEVTLGSVVIDLPHAFLLVAKAVKDHTFKPGVISLGAKEDVVKWVPNPALANEITPATRARVDSVATQLRAGTFTIPK
jgi:basic membrane lipoprotein Med (substrate-binding protein (PBP1-ABC) superfamily)